MRIGPEKTSVLCNSGLGVHIWGFSEFILLVVLGIREFERCGGWNIVGIDTFSSFEKNLDFDFKVLFVFFSLTVFELKSEVLVGAGSRAVWEILSEEKDAPRSLMC